VLKKLIQTHKKLIQRRENVVEYFEYMKNKNGLISNTTTHHTGGKHKKISVKKYKKTLKTKQKYKRNK
jgi:hypothetical protein